MFRTSIAVSRQDLQKLNYRLFENNWKRFATAFNLFHSWKKDDSFTNLHGGGHDLVQFNLFSLNFVWTALRHLAVNKKKTLKLEPVYVEKTFPKLKLKFSERLYETN